MAGIYIHIPFCRQKCHYCDFYSVAATGQRETMIEALHRELDQRSGYLGDESVSTLYFGGGTPTVYSPEVLQGLIDRVKRLFAVKAFEEVTVEANPDDLTDSYLVALAATEVDRLSVGVQSFSDAHLSFFNRRHTGQEAFDALLRARSHGFENITVDLIYGVPGMTRIEWERNLRRFLELELPHLSAYHLTIEDRTVLGKQVRQGRVVPVVDAVSEGHYALLEQVMDEAGYDHYEVSNFARPGYQALHNSHYWRGVSYLGIGPSAHSYDGYSRQWNVASNKSYLEQLEGGTYFTVEQLSETDRLNEAVMTALRTSRGLCWEAFRNRFGEDRIASLRRTAARFVAEGLMEEDEEGLRIPSRHFLLSDFLISALFVV